MPDAELAAVGSRSRETAESFAREFAIARAYRSWADLVADDSVDVVYVATPAHAHRAATELCIEAGKAVLCEKPFMLDATAARSIVELARARGVFLMEAMWMRCNPAIVQLAALVRDGAIGTVRCIHADLGTAERPDGDADTTEADGALLDNGVYPVSFAHMLLGWPSAVTAWSHATAGGADLNTGIVLGYDSGATALLSCGIVAETPSTAFVAGTRGWIELPPDFTRPGSLTVRRDGEAETIHLPWTGHGYVHEAAEVMRCIREHRTQSPLVPWRATIEVMEILDAVRTHARANAWHALPAR